jgi:RimJ/RimL family protein N-acetyltransferase
VVGVRIEQVEPDDAATFGAWFEVLDAAGQVARPEEPDWLPHELRQHLLHGSDPDGPYATVALLGRDDDGRPVAAGRLDLPLRDNPELAEVDLRVAPGSLRRGYGTELLAALDARAAAAGRTTLLAYVDEPPGVPAAGRAFAERVGASCAQLEVRRDLDLPPDADRLAALEAACLPHAGGYTLRTWTGSTPEELLDGRAELSRRMSIDVPLGELPLSEEVWDADRVRQKDALAVDQQRLTVGAVALDGQDQMVALTELAVPRPEPVRAYQWDTIVAAEHRGHRLGTLVKIAALRRLAAVSPRSRLLSTWNAQENAHMIAVNEALGFRTAGTESAWTRPVGGRRAARG